MYEYKFYNDKFKIYIEIYNVRYLKSVLTKHLIYNTFRYEQFMILHIHMHG